MEYRDLEKAGEHNRLIYQARFGRKDLEPYKRTKAFIFLEGETKGKADPVEATELANLLTGKSIPVCILNACQSGKQVASETEDNRETSIRKPLSGIANLPGATAESL